MLCYDKLGSKATLKGSNALSRCSIAWMTFWFLSSRPTLSSIHSINLSIHTSLSQTHNICMHLHMQHVATPDILNTVKCINPNTDILQQLDEIIHKEIKQLHDYIVHTLGSQQIMCYICGQFAHCT